MDQYIEYLSGYTVAVMLALSSTAAVACFMISSTALPITILFSVSCFILNLILFWQGFDNILQIPETLKPANALPICLTACASMITYAMTVFSFYGLCQSYLIISLLFPPALIHFISLCTAVGFFGLYIESFIDFVDSDLQSLPINEFVFGSILTVCLLLSSANPIYFFSFSSLVIYFSFNYDIKPLLRIWAITASMILTINGMGASLPTLYRFAQGPSSLYVLKTFGFIGLISLTICDALFSYNAMDRLITRVPKYRSFSDHLGLFLTGCNALANSQITAGGKGFSHLYAWLGGGMSYVVMTVSVQKVSSKSSKKKPPFSPNENMTFALFMYNSILYLSFSTWLCIYRPKAFRALKNLFKKPVLTQSITCGTIAKSSVFAAHFFLWTKMPNNNNSKRKSILQKQKHYSS